MEFFLIVNYVLKMYLAPVSVQLFFCSFLVSTCDTKQDRAILTDLARLLDFARLQSLNKATNVNENLTDYENIQDPRIKKLWDLKAFFKSKAQSSRRRGIGYNK